MIADSFHDSRTADRARRIWHRLHERSGPGGTFILDGFAFDRSDDAGSAHPASTTLIIAGEVRATGRYVLAPNQDSGLRAWMVSQLPGNTVTTEAAEWTDFWIRGKFIWAGTDLDCTKLDMIWRGVAGRLHVFSLPQGDVVPLYGEITVLPTPVGPYDVLVNLSSGRPNDPAAETLIIGRITGPHRFVTGTAPTPGSD